MTHPLDGNTHALEAHLAAKEAARAGDEEGHRCNVGGCNGHMAFDDVEGCTCHISPPCHACFSNPLNCDKCGREVGE